MPHRAQNVGGPEEWYGKGLVRPHRLDAVAIWEWGAVERVSTGLLCTKIGLEPIGGQMLDAADHVAD